MSQSIRSWQELAEYLSTKHLTLADCSLPSDLAVSGTFPIRIPHHYAELINWRDPQDPLRLMTVPSISELETREYELNDPIGDHTREVVPGLIHRYPDRCLLLLTSYCLVHCRFCFRKEVVGKVRPVNFQGMVKYLSEHQEIHEIIFSGGDPATMPAGFLLSVAKHFHSLKHIHRYRFHTRVPAVDPESISEEWLQALDALPADKKIVVIHINHVRELSVQTKILINRLLDMKVLVLSQSVLLKGINTTEKDLRELFTGLVDAGVKPYYLHHLDKAMGTHHFRISISEGKKLFTSLRGRLSSVCLPEYLLDLPGGYGKIPVMWLKQLDENRYEAQNFEGQRITYIDPA